MTPLYFRNLKPNRKLLIPLNSLHLCSFETLLLSAFIYFFSQIIDRRLKLMEDEGIQFLTNQNIGQNLSLEHLFSYDAILIAIGSTKPRSLPIAGYILL